MESVQFPQVGDANMARMAGRRVRFSPQYDSMHVEGVGDALLMDRDHTFSSLEVIGPASLSSLRRAMMAVYPEYDYGGADPRADLPRFSVQWSLDSAANFDDDLSLAERVSVALMRDGSLAIECDVQSNPPPRTESDIWTEAMAVLDAWLEPRRGRLVSFTPYPGYRGYWTVRFEIPIRGLTVADANQIGNDAIAVIEAYADGDGASSIEPLVALLHAGHAKALLGLSEHQLLEAKRSLHLVDEKSRLELAKDVSAMANSPTGGVIVVGLETKRRSGQDVIAAIHPVPDTGQVRVIRKVLDRLIYPPIEQLDVSLAPADPSRPANQHLILLTVPRQPRELVPFLVIGSIVGGQLLGNYVGLFERRGEDILVSGAASIHAGLSAGLALLRRAAAGTAADQ